MYIPKEVAHKRYTPELKKMVVETMRNEQRSDKNTVRMTRILTVYTSDSVFC